MQPVPVPDTLPLFPLLDTHLLVMLRSLSGPEWELPTVAPGWRVRDVALHLLDGSLRSLSMLRDGHFAGPGPASGEYPEVVRYLNELNRSWVAAGQRLSPAVVTWLLELVGPAYTAYLASLDPEAPATFAVVWAGEQQSTNQFHTAREYTEKWHHQQQIRHALGQEAALLTPELYHPFLATSVRALPYHYRQVDAPAGTVVRLHLAGPVTDTWFLQRTGGHWELGQQYNGPVAAELELDSGVAWRLFTKSLPRTEAEQHLRCKGPEQLTSPLYSLVAVMG